MTIVVLLFLAGIWGVVLYGYFRDRLADTRPADSIGSFRHQLSVLERTGPLGHASPRHRIEAMHATIPAARVSSRPAPLGAAPASRRTSAAAKRRRDILFGLLAAMAGSLLLSFAPGLRVMLLFHVAVDVLFVGYIALLVRLRNIRAEREMKLRFLPTASMAPEPALLLRRTGN